MGKFSYKLEDASFYGILDTGYVKEENLYSKCKDLILSGAKIIQLRAKKEDAHTRRLYAQKIHSLFLEANAPIFIINDDIELAKSLEKAGLHVGQDDIDVEYARQYLGEDRVIGLSTHSLNEAINAIKLKDVLDYFAVGPVYATQTKPGRQAVGLELVKAVSELNSELPWFAIGGVNIQTAKEVRKANARRIVAVSEVLIAEDTVGAVKKLLDEFLSC